MAFPLPLLAALLAVFLFLLIRWIWHRHARVVTAPQPARRSAEAMEPAAGLLHGREVTEVMQQAQGRFLALALGMDAADKATTLDEPHRAVVGAVVAALGRADLSPRYTPRRPQLLPQLIQSVNDTAASSRSISAIIGQDALLAANLLRIANSPVYRLQPRAVESIERAVTLVGTDGIRQIISAALVQPVMNAHGHGGSRFPDLVWEYSMRVSAAAADHARSVEHDDGFAAQLMGLLQGLGAVVVMQAAQDEYARHPGLQPSPWALRMLLERCTQTTAARIASHWQLAPAIGQALHDGDTAAAQQSALGRALQFGRTAAAAAVLCQERQMEDEQALAMLTTLVPAHVVGWIWRRIGQQADNPDISRAPR